MSVIQPNGVGATQQRDQRGGRHAYRYDGPPATGGGAGAAAPGVSPRVMQRIALLPTRDRAILELTLRSRLSRARISRALGLSPGQVSRRVRALYARVHDPLVAALLDPRCPLAGEYRQLGIEHFLQGASAPQLAEKHRLAKEHVRRMLAHVRWWHKGASAAWDAGASRA